MTSENGTQVNGRRVDAGVDVQLVEGDQIVIGRTRLIFTNDEQPDLRSAFDQWHQPSERGKSTLQANPE